MERKHHFKAIVKTPIGILLSLIMVTLFFVILGVLKIINLMGPDGMPKFLQNLIYLQGIQRAMATGAKKREEEKENGNISSTGIYN